GAAQTPSPSPSTVLSPVRFVSTGPGSRIDIDASFPPNPNVCQANQTPDIKAAYPGTLEVGRQANGRLYLITELSFPEYLKAVDDTASQILEYGGKPIDAFYFSTSNGHTYSAADVFGGSAVPYLQPVTESDDTASPTSNWSVRMPLTDLAEILRLSGSWGSEPIDSVGLQGDTVKVAGGGTST